MDGNNLEQVAQNIGIRLKAKTISYDDNTETYSYYCNGDIIHRFTKKELTRYTNSDNLKQTANNKIGRKQVQIEVSGT